MSVERKVRALAGSLVIISLLLSLVSKWWLLLTAFVGLNLFQSAFSGFCPAEMVLKKLEEKKATTSHKEAHS
ncbi:sulfurtransferase [Methylacidiphilum kamchatkense Kam1]|jgi:hypothetical protein|uniref:Sulfurtransferase n=1 Tax=Methylacidiphilum kamchatkense Kam1 TaxID=1202785 RepID=A0A0C1RM51_9BACT|nr:MULTISPECIES: DUF2892 domain-containing protein [Methylacidiphilum (ex Ratnadevi et al. 2023)]KIE59137.1 sulfurtransferase [Methylacidiphilum kamchatkense Kam1]QDQ42938.1 hypothetical protein kam1_1723 [Methylacidiphilum kamchatkense Kam1]TFE68057.1 sulfurtransferase [Methylacidiphilum sp. Yel]